MQPKTSMSIQSTPQFSKKKKKSSHLTSGSMASNFNRIRNFLIPWFPVCIPEQIAAVQDKENMHRDNLRRKNAWLWDRCWEKTKPIKNKTWHETEQVLKQTVLRGGAAALQGAHWTKTLEESEGFLLRLASLGTRNSTVFTCLK